MKRHGLFDTAIRELERYRGSLVEFSELQGGPSEKWKAECRIGVEEIKAGIAVLKAAGKFAEDPSIRNATTMTNAIKKAKDAIKEKS